MLPIRLGKNGWAFFFPLASGRNRFRNTNVFGLCVLLRSRQSPIWPESAMPASVKALTAYPKLRYAPLMLGRNRSRFFVLPVILLLVLLVQVLPQFDSATAFCGNSEPLMVHSAIVASPLMMMLVSAVHSMPPNGRGSLHLLSTTVLSAAACEQPEYRLRC